MTDGLSFYNVDYGQDAYGAPTGPGAGGAPAGAMGGRHAAGVTPTMGGPMTSAAGSHGGGDGGGGGGYDMWRGSTAGGLGAAMGAPESASPVDDDLLDEPPLLEELGIHFPHIRSKTWSVLHPLRQTMDQEALEDADLAGPLVFALALGSALLLSGKVHFGYIYGLFAVGSVALYGVLNLMSERPLDLMRTVSILGYCLLPMVFLAISAVFLPLAGGGVLGYVLAAGTVAWCTQSASIMFVLSLAMRDQRWLVAYPVGLLYWGFALLTIF